MEPERKIEKWLRAFAKKRRAEARDAFQLHPAARRMLQGEVARQAPKPDAEPDSFSLWELLRERWAVLLGFALIIFFGASLFLPALSTAKHRSQSSVTAGKLKQIGVAAQFAAADSGGKLPATLDALTNQLGSREVLTDSVSGKPFVYVAGGASLSELQSSNVLAYSPADKDRAVLFADGSVRRVSGGEFSLLTNQTSLALAMAENTAVQKASELSAPAAAPSLVGGVPISGAANGPVPAVPPSAIAVAAPAPAVAPPLDRESATAGEMANRTLAVPPAAAAGVAATPGEFASAANPHSLGAEKLMPAQNAAKFKSEPAADSFQPGGNNSQRYRQMATTKIPSVLESFELRQNGNQLSVVDQDGSVYNGRLQPVEVAVQDDTSKTGESAVKPGSSGLLKKDFGAAGNAQQQMAQNYSFRVSGANRSLKQNVVFTGNLTPISNATVANTTQNFGGGGGAGGQSKLADANIAQQQQLFSNSRITGTVMIGRTNQIEINAMPVNP